MGEGDRAAWFFLPETEYFYSLCGVTFYCIVKITHRITIKQRCWRSSKRSLLVLKVRICLPRLAQMLTLASWRVLVESLTMYVISLQKLRLQHLNCQTNDFLKKYLCHVVVGIQNEVQRTRCLFRLCSYQANLTSQATIGHLTCSLAKIKSRLPFAKTHLKPVNSIV